MNLSEIAKSLNELKENIVLIYAFNSTGKTRLSVAFKDETKDTNDKHTGVYYNAFSEDLFTWNNDEDNNGQNICLEILLSSLSQFHTSITEDSIKEKLNRYNPKYNFKFKIHKDSEEGIKEVYFFKEEDEKETKIKISRGEERIFVWCFFLALFEVEGWADRQSKHFFIDDPVSSLDEHNIFMTAITLFDLIEDNFKNKKIILTTHHIGLFSILYNWLNNGEKADKFKNKNKAYILDNNELKPFNKSVFLYHLHLLQKLKKAKDDEEFFSYQFVLLRQVLENIASFLGSGRFSYVLEKIGIEDYSEDSNIINILSHKRIFYHETDIMNDENKEKFKEILEKLLTKYDFDI